MQKAENSDMNPSCHLAAEVQKEWHHVLAGSLWLGQKSYSEYHLNKEIINDIQKYEYTRK
jgi:hypothetical protein